MLLFFGRVNTNIAHVITILLQLMPCCALPCHSAAPIHICVYTSCQQWRKMAAAMSLSFAPIAYCECAQLLCCDKALEAAKQQVVVVKLTARTIPIDNTFLSAATTTNLCGVLNSIILKELWALICVYLLILFLGKILTV